MATRGYRWVYSYFSPLMISPLLRQATLSQPWFYSIHFGGRSLDEFLDHFFYSNSKLFVGCLFWVPCSTHPRLYHCTSWLFDLLSEPFMVHKMHGGYSGLVLDCHPKALALPQGGMDGKISVSDSWGHKREVLEGTVESQPLPLPHTQAQSNRTSKSQTVTVNVGNKTDRSL